MVSKANAEDQRATPTPNTTIEASRDGLAIEVVGASSNELELIRAGAKTAIEHFSHCGLQPLMPIRIEIVEAKIDVCGVDAFGSYDARTQEIRLLSARVCEKMASANAAYASLPFREFYKSLVTHEVAHAILQSHLKDRKVSLATHEYVAYAVQIDSMAPDVREKFLEQLKREPPDDLSPFVDMVLLMSPETFSALAYAHFSKPGNGCRILKGVVEGRIVFPGVEEFD